MNRLTYIAALVLITLSVTQSSNSQAIQHLPSLEVSWNVWKCCGPDHTLTYFIEGDTIIEDQMYAKLYLSWDTIANSANDEFYGGLREDTMMHIYFNPIFAEEYLLYDFNLTKGDTFELDGPFNYGGSIVVDTVTIQVFEGIARSVISFQESEFSIKNEYWVVGIGSSFGLLEAGAYQGPDIETALLCAYQGDTIIYMNSIWQTCFMSTVEVKEPIKNPTISLIYPNPAIDHITIVPPDDAAESMRLLLYDIYGRLTLERDIEGTTTISLGNDLPPGTYIYTIRSGRGDIVQTGKVVVL